MKEYIVFETPYWKVVLSDNQKYIGRSVVLLKRECGDLADLQNEEILDFLEVVKTLEKLLRKTFNATMFNWTCLMNDSYKEINPNPQVHWHCWPRYNHPVEFMGEIFEDPNFGHHYLRGPEDKRAILNSSMESLLNLLRSNL